MSHQTDIDDDLAFENMLFGGEDRSPPPSATDASQSQRFPFEAERSGEGAKAAAMDVPGSGAQNASVASSANGSYTGSSAPRIRIRSRGKRDMRRDVSSGDCRELFFSGLKTEEAHQEMAPLLRQLKVNGGLAKVHSEPHQDFGYLTFESPEKLRSAMVELDGKKVANCTLSVNKVAQVCPGQDYRIIQQFGKPSCNVVLRNAPYELCEESLLQALVGWLSVVFPLCSLACVLTGHAYSRSHCVFIRRKLRVFPRSLMFSSGRPRKGSSQEWPLCGLTVCRAHRSPARCWPRPKFPAATFGSSLRNQSNPPQKKRPRWPRTAIARFALSSPPLRKAVCNSLAFPWDSLPPSARLPTSTPTTWVLSPTSMPAC